LAESHFNVNSLFWFRSLDRCCFIKMIFRIGSVSVWPSAAFLWSVIASYSFFTNPCHWFTDHLLLPKSPSNSRLICTIHQSLLQQGWSSVNEPRAIWTAIWIDARENPRQGDARFLTELY
jgi:hypothetical protein